MCSCYLTETSLIDLLLSFRAARLELAAAYLGLERSGILPIGSGNISVMAPRANGQGNAMFTLPEGVGLKQVKEASTIHALSCELMGLSLSYYLISTYCTPRNKASLTVWLYWAVILSFFMYCTCSPYGIIQIHRHITRMSSVFVALEGY